MRKLYTYLLLSMIVTLPLAGGCIRENMDDCKGKVTLRFRYVGDGTTDIFPEKIEHVTMYVYSIADGSLAAIQKYDDNALAAYQAGTRSYAGAMRSMKQPSTKARRSPQTAISKIRI